MWKFFEKLFAFGRFRTNLGEGSPVMELPTKALTAEQKEELRMILPSKGKPIQVWYDPIENQLYTKVQFGPLMTKTYSDIGAFTDSGGQKFYWGGVFEGEHMDPRKLGLVLIGEL